MCNCLFLFGWFGNLCLLLPVVYCLGLYGLIVSFTSCPFLSCLVFSLFDKSSLVLSYLLLSCLVFISWVLSCHVVLYPDLFRSFLASNCFVLSFTNLLCVICLDTIRLLRFHYPPPSCPFCPGGNPRNPVRQREAFTGATNNRHFRSPHTVHPHHSFLLPTPPFLVWSCFVVASSW
jgi:hypothetical protein